MNFLAHLWLAEKTKTSFAGAILGDIARGADLSAYPDEIERGIRLHRKIDAATDRHPLSVAARERFGQGRRRYAGIVMDLVCDHILASDWSRYSDEALPDFCLRASNDIEQAGPWFIHAGGRAIEAQGFSKLLISYAGPAGIEYAIGRTANRMRDSQPLIEAAKGWERVAEEFRPSLPELLNALRGTHPTD
ncbi:MAG: ACP phosphodiesterase [Pseudomonadota bacterium]